MDTSLCRHRFRRAIRRFTNQTPIGRIRCATADAATKRAKEFSLVEPEQKFLLRRWSLRCRRQRASVNAGTGRPQPTTQSDPEATRSFFLLHQRCWPLGTSVGGMGWAASAPDSDQPRDQPFAMLRVDEDRRFTFEEWYFHPPSNRESTIANGEVRKLRHTNQTAHQTPPRGEILEITLNVARGPWGDRHRSLSVNVNSIVLWGHPRSSRWRKFAWETISPGGDCNLPGLLRPLPGKV
jgi:hypothetical protein